MEKIKRPYVPPHIETIVIELEEGIATGSVHVGNVDGEVSEQWEQDDDVYKEHDFGDDGEWW